MNFNELTNPTNALQVLDTTGLVRIPFSSLNNTIKDMISVYAADLMSVDDYDAICDAEGVLKRMDTKTSYFYIFKRSQYLAFLKLIARENTMHNGSMTCTAESDIIYSTQQGKGYADCPVFSLVDTDKFEHIECTAYHRNFDKDNIHLCKLVTRRQAIGCCPIKLTEVCLFIPE